jgi:hypothetical protein
MPVCDSTVHYLCWVGIFFLVRLMDAPMSRIPELWPLTCP